MAPHRTFNQDILAQRSVWEDLARTLGGTFVIHPTVDRTCTRFTLTVPRALGEVMFEASDLHRWHVRATGPCEGLSPFTLSPWDLLDSLTSLLGGHRATLTHPDLPQTYLVTGPDAAQVASILADPHLRPLLSPFSSLQASLRGVPTGFELALLTGDPEGFPEEAPRALALVDALLQALFEAGLLAKEAALPFRR